MEPENIRRRNLFFNFLPHTNSKELPAWLIKALNIKKISDVNKLSTNFLRESLKKYFLSNPDLVHEGFKFAEETLSSTGELKRLSETLFLILNEDLTAKKVISSSNGHRRDFLKTVSFLASQLTGKSPLGMVLNGGRKSFNIGFDPPVIPRAPIVIRRLLYEVQEEHPELIGLPISSWYEPFKADVESSLKSIRETYGIEDFCDPDEATRETIALLFNDEIIFRTKSFEIMERYLLNKIPELNELPLEDRHEIVTNSILDGDPKEKFSHDILNPYNPKILDPRKDFLDELVQSIDDNFDFKAATSNELMAEIRKETREELREYRRKQKELKIEKDFFDKYLLALKARITGVIEDPRTHKEKVLDTQEYEAAYEWLLADEIDLQDRACYDTEKY